MKRKILIITLLAILTFQMSVFAVTTGLVNDGVGILFIQDNGVPIRSQWITLGLENDGKEEYYYFASDGYLTANGKTEDGYDVNEKGQWVVDGVVQHKISTTQVTQSGGYIFGADGKPVGKAADGTTIVNPNNGVEYIYSEIAGRWAKNNIDEIHAKERAKKEYTNGLSQEEIQAITNQITLNVN